MLFTLFYFIMEEMYFSTIETCVISYVS